jgi:hypothetical protein
MVPMMSVFKSKVTEIRVLCCALAVNYIFFAHKKPHNVFIFSTHNSAVMSYRD